MTALVQKEPFDIFREAFFHNIQTRSRTAKGEFTAGIKGEPKAQASTIKKAVKKSGDALKAQVAENTETLIRVILASWPKLHEDIHSLRFAMEIWYDIIQTELY